MLPPCDVVETSNQRAQSRDDTRVSTSEHDATSLRSDSVQLSVYQSDSQGKCECVIGPVCVRCVPIRQQRACDVTSPFACDACRDDNRGSSS